MGNIFSRKTDSGQVKPVADHGKKKKLKFIK